MSFLPRLLEFRLGLRFSLLISLDGLLLRYECLAVYCVYSDILMMLLGFELFCHRLIILIWASCVDG
jgi:hypothetical protein